MSNPERMIELKRVVITGVGIVSPLGIGKEPFLEALLAGRSGVRRIERFDTTGFPVKIAAEVRDFDPLAFIDKKWAKRMDRYAQYGAAAIMALEDSGYPVDEIPMRWERWSVRAWAVWTPSWSRPASLGQGSHARQPLLYPHDDSQHGLGLQLHPARAQGPREPRPAPPVRPVPWPRRRLRADQARDATAMFAGGAETAVNQVGMSAFAALRALCAQRGSPNEPDRPFDADRDGFVMGGAEGCSF